MKNILSNPTAYHYLRQVMTLGLPFKEFVREFGLQHKVRVADIGCGPADILRYLSKKTGPEIYLGVDVSKSYLHQAEKRAKKQGIQAVFNCIDLTTLQSSLETRNELIKLLMQHSIERVLLLGIVHHINDESVLNTLEIIYSCSTVKKIFTWDVVLEDGRTFNNYLARKDRGAYVRTENEYVRLLQKSKWSIARTFWTHPGMKAIDYIHFELVRL